MSTSKGPEQFGTIERLIFDQGIRTVGVDTGADVLVVVLSTAKTMVFRLSAFPLLRDADADEVRNAPLIGDGIGLHWPDPDEDLSLKGFLADYFIGAIGGNTQYAMAA